MRLFKLYIVVTGFIISSSAALADPYDENKADMSQNLAEAVLDWIRSTNGGYVSPKVEFRSLNPNDSDGDLSSSSQQIHLFANQDINDGEPILILPKGATNHDGQSNAINSKGSRILDDRGQSHSHNIICRTTRNLIREINLGNSSTYWPYIQYLSHLNPALLPDNETGEAPLSHPQLPPAAWSKDGKMLFEKVIGENPMDILDQHFNNCVYLYNPFHFHALITVLQRNWNGMLLPVHDMMRHRNGKYLNTDITSSGPSLQHESITITASRHIEAGEELFRSYNLCRACGENRKERMGTPDIFRNHGFVEDYPQRWIFPDMDVAFEIKESENMSAGGRKDNDGKNLELSWLFDRMPNSNDLHYLWRALEYLENISQKIIEKADPMVPHHELNTISQYLKSMEFAFSFAIEESQNLDEAMFCDGDNDSQHCINDIVDLSKYEQEIHWYWSDTCDNQWLFNRFEYEYELLETINSPYQEINFFRDEENNDMCFELDLTTQICSSYRPHYHEMVVHYTARFLPKVERVLWVGGGDSMLLHEILKYPHLELVVGLEIDQKVTRNAFKYFGSQPHWDNEKVQWWYGDAAKSLMMLPEDYFGSFDMVLVDLSETVMSLKVTDGLDIMQALGLLLKPEGILVKNEITYFEKLKEIYAHAVQVHFYDCPVICHQGLTLVSNHNAMISTSLTDHEIDTKNLFIKPLNASYHHSLIHDYNWDDSNKDHCMRDDDNLSIIPPKQKESPGILMIVEAEEIEVNSDSLHDLEENLVSAVKKEGLTIVSTILSSDIPGIDSNTIIFTLQEGYIVAKMFAEERYCAFDIYLWSRTWKQVNVKNSILKAVGAKLSSQLRVVAGGMFGMESWKGDQLRRGPRRTDPCDITLEKKQTSPFDLKSIEIILRESFTVSQKESGFVLVLCGLESEENCSTLEALKNIRKTDQTVIPLWTCPTLLGYEEDMTAQARECKKSVMEKLLEIVSEDQKVEAIVLDPNLSMKYAGVVAKILNRAAWEEYCNKDILIVSLNKVTESINWRPNFFKRFQTELLIYDPVFRAEFTFNSSIEVNVLALNEQFAFRLNETINVIGKETGIVPDITKIRGGHFNFQENFREDNYDTTYFFKPSDYDQREPFKQWISQTPLERQVLFQLEGHTSITSKKIYDAFRSALETEGIDAMVMEQPVFGEGALFTALWSEGRAIISWDGRRHVDINLSFPAKTSPKNFDAFVYRVTTQLEGLSVVLRDEQSRGTGRVVNFIGDIEPKQSPFWMM